MTLEIVLSKLSFTPTAENKTETKSEQQSFPKGLKDTPFRKHYQKVFSAYSNNTFSPERAALSICNDYGEQLTQDLAALADASETGSTGNYAAKYEAKFLAWISAVTRTANWVITGPAGFNVAKNDKANASERKRYDEFVNWRKKYFQAVNRVPRPSTEDWLSNLLLELDKQQDWHEKVKVLRKSVRKGEITLEESAPLLMQLGLSYALKDEHALFGSYVLSNSNQRISAIKKRIEAAEARIATAKTFEPITFRCEGLDGEVTIEESRVCIYFEGKPSKEVCQTVRGSAFKWSRRNMRWQRQHTANAVYVAETLVAKLQREYPDSCAA